MSSKDYKKIAFYPNRKIFSQKFIRWNAELDEWKKFFDIMGTLNLSPCINLQVTDDSGKIFQLPVPVA